MKLMKGFQKTLNIEIVIIKQKKPRLLTTSSVFAVLKNKIKCYLQIY